MDGSVDYTLIPHAMRIDLLDAIQRQKAELAATEQVLLHAMNVSPDVSGSEFDVHPKDAKRWVREEVVCAVRISPQVAASRLESATHLVTKLPATLAALRDGQLSMLHATRLCEATFPLPDRVIAKVEKAVLPRAGVQTVAQFAASVNRAVARYDTREQEQKHADAVADRRVIVTPQPHGVTELWAVLPADTAAAISDAVQQHADASQGLDDRTADQRRADALTDLILGDSNVEVSVGVTVSLSALLSLDEQGAELRGHGPIPAALARALAFDPHSTWRRLLTDCYDQYLEAGAHTYRPGALLDRHIRYRDQTCRFPGCRRDAVKTEIDHRIAWDHGGLTVPDNLHVLCKRHHHLKHETRWTVTRHDDGSTRWRDPTGHHYQQPPPDPLPADTTMSGAGADPPHF